MKKSEVKLDFNIDGIPIFKSKKSQLWPILARFEDLKPFLVGAYYGRGHPDSADAYLEDLVNELESIIGNVLSYKDKRK